MTAKEHIAELRQFVTEVRDQLYEKQDMYRCRDLAKQAAGNLDALEKKLEGEREWGYQFTTGTQSVVTGITKEMARDMTTRFPEYKLVSRRKAGPWEEENQR